MSTVVVSLALLRFLWPLTPEQKANRRAVKESARLARLEKRVSARKATAKREEREIEDVEDAMDSTHAREEESAGLTVAEGSFENEHLECGRAPHRVNVTENGHVTVDVASVAEAQHAKVELRQYLADYRQKIRDALREQKEIRARHAREIRIQESKFKGGVAEGRFAKSMVTDAKDKARSRMVKELKPWEELRVDLETRIARINDLIVQLDQYIAEKKD